MAGLACLHANAAYGQATSRVTPETAAPVERLPDGELALPETRVTAAPEGAEELFVEVGMIEVVDADPAFAAEIERIVAPYAGRTVAVSELYGVAAQIEALYARSGQILTRATVPPQQLTDGSTFRIRIVEGFIEAVDASALPARVRSAVEARAARLVGRRRLTMRDIERHLLLAARVPGVALTSALAPGEQVGGARLILNADYRPVSGRIGVENRLSDAYDNWSVDAQIVLNSMLGAGEQIYAVGSTATDFAIFENAPMRRIAGAGVIVPIGTDGLTLNAEYLHADTNPNMPQGAAPIAGKLDRVALRLRYPLVLTRQESLNLSASFDLLEESQRVRGFSPALSRDKLRFVQLGMDWSKALGGGTVVSADLAATQGLAIFDARDEADALASGVLLSRQGSEPDFTKIEGSASLALPIGGGFLLTGIARGQASLSGALPSSAQFSLDAADALSGFELGSINVDSGATGRIELAFAGYPQVPFVSPYLFAAGGLGRVSQPTVLERRDVDGWSLGGGLRFELEHGLSAHGELARSHSNIFNDDDTRMTAGIAFRF
ncbi:ShlB/FhaC/HecB family hemolysin secretion/activation protein [Alteraurantiacibacter aquimixticola]|nr:ShlB/FhaC/HecB family hemolysin secretion/activation protein [Alteraurantiacibacter aquimixticola]